MMATPSIAKLGTHELKEKYLAPAIAGTAVAAIGVSEPDMGSDVSALRTKAVRDGDDWLITGRKTYITNGAQADWVCLLARTSDEGGHRGMSQIIVPTDTAGFAVSRTLDKLGNRCSDTAELVLDEVRVPVANTIGEIGRGFQQQMQQFIVERMFVAYSAVGQCNHALERTRAYAHERKVFGQSLASKQYVAFKLAELQAQVDLLQSHNMQVCEAILAGGDITRMASVAKLTAGRLVREVADWCIQFTGASDTSKKPGPRVSSGTRVWPPSGAGPTKSCCRSFPGSTASRPEGSRTGNPHGPDHPLPVPAPPPRLKDQK